MELSAQHIAQLLDGTIEGDPNVLVNTLSKIEEAKSGSIAFLANPKYNSFIYTSKASIFVIAKDFKLKENIQATLIRVEDAYAAFAILLETFNKQQEIKKEVSQLACIHKTASLGDNVYIGEFVSIGKNVKLGKNCKIYPNTVIGDNVHIGDHCIIYSGVNIYPESKIGHHCIIHSGAVIGSDGFGFAIEQGSSGKKLPQTGNVLIEDYVEIGSNTSIDRATLGSTILRKGVKLDNLIQVAHNVEIGENTVIAAQTGIAGSTKIGKNCMIGGQTAIVGHLIIGNNVKIQGQSGVTKNLKDGTTVQGSPAFEIGQFKRSYIQFKNSGKTNLKK